MRRFDGIQNGMLIDQPFFALGRLGVFCHSDFVAGQAMNRYRGTQAEFQFSIRPDSDMPQYALRTVRFRVNNPAIIKLTHRRAGS